MTMYNITFINRGKIPNLKNQLLSELKAHIHFLFRDDPSSDWSCHAWENQIMKNVHNPSLARLLNIKLELVGEILNQ